MQKDQDYEGLRKQIQFYMSDANLEQDQFFHNLIKQNPEGYISMSILLNCKIINNKFKIKEIEPLRKAIQKSPLFQINPNNENLFRRKNNPQLPPLTKPRKKLKLDTPVDNPFHKIQVEIFKITSEKQTALNFKLIQQALVRIFNIFSPYTRFSKTEGHFAVNKKNFTEELKDKMQKEGLEVANQKLKINLCKGKDLQQFFAKHGFHFNGIIDRASIIFQLEKQFEKKVKQQKRVQKTTKQFEFLGQIYTDINKLKSMFKIILNRTPNKMALKQQDEKMVIQLLKFHPNATKKLLNKKQVVVDIHPDYKDTRCFFIVRQDGSREDFSLLKCLQGLIST